MIASWIVKRIVRSVIEKMNEDDFDVDAVAAGFADNAIFNCTSEIGVGETIKGKQAIAEWARKWKLEFPKRKFVVKNICFSVWPIFPTGVLMVEWSLTETSKEGKEFKYDGVAVMHVKNFKVVQESEYISFAGLPKLSTLIKPTSKA